MGEARHLAGRRRILGQLGRCVAHSPGGILTSLTSCVWPCNAVMERPGGTSPGVSSLGRLLWTTRCDCPQGVAMGAALHVENSAQQWCDHRHSCIPRAGLLRIALSGALASVRVKPVRPSTRSKWATTAQFVHTQGFWAGGVFLSRAQQHACAERPGGE